MLSLILTTFVTICIPTASTQNSITSKTTGDVVLGSDAVLAWEVKLASEMRSFGGNIRNGTKDGPILWTDDGTVTDYKKIFGKRATFQKKNARPTGFTLEMQIKNVNFNDSMTFTYSAVVGKIGDITSITTLDSTIQLKVSGINVAADLLPNITVEENQKTTFSVTIAGVPRPDVTWTLTGQAQTTTTQKELDTVMKQYEYTSEITSFGAADCGHTLSYKARGFTEKGGKVTINVLFKPSQVNNVQFYRFEEGSQECQELTWNKVEAGKCGPSVRYAIKIMNDSDILTFTTYGEKTTFRTCNATDAKIAIVQAMYDVKTGMESEVAVFKKKKPSTTVPPTTTVECKYFGMESQVGLFLGGFIAAVLIETLLIVFHSKRKLKKRKKGSVYKVPIRELTSSTPQECKELVQDYMGLSEAFQLSPYSEINRITETPKNHRQSCQVPPDNVTAPPISQYQNYTIPSKNCVYEVFDEDV